MPIAFLIEAAGGSATDGIIPILDVVPRDLHQNVLLFFGARDEIARIHDHLTRTWKKEKPVARIALRQLLDHAAERGCAVPAVNIDNKAQGVAIMAAAAAEDASVILLASRGARSSAIDTMLRRMPGALAEICPAARFASISVSYPAKIGQTDMSNRRNHVRPSTRVLRWKP